MEAASAPRTAVAAGWLRWFAHLSGLDAALFWTFCVVTIASLYAVLTRGIASREARERALLTAPRHSKLRVKELVVYPIKACQGVSVREARVAPTGLYLDREWSVVCDGHVQTALLAPKLLTVKISILDDTERIRVSAPSMSRDLLLDATQPPAPPDPARLVDVVLLRTSRKGLVEGAEAHAWFAELLERPNTTLVRVCRGHLTLLRDDPKYAKLSTLRGDTDKLSWSYNAHTLVAHEASLREVHRRMREIDAEAPLPPMRRFRANIVVGSPDDENAVPPFDEDYWRQLQLRPQSDATTDLVHLRYLKPCARCEIITKCETTGQRVPTEGSLLLATLRAFRRASSELYAAKPLFGVNFNWEDAAGDASVRSVVRVGDVVEVLQRAPLTERQVK